MQAIDGEHLVQPFAETGGRRRPISLEPGCVLLDALLALLLVQLPGGTKGGSSLIVLLFGQMPLDVSQLVIAASLHGVLPAIHLADRFPQGLRAVDHEQPTTPRRFTW